jgi:hypothetical protein
MRFSLTHLLALILLTALSSPTVLAAPAIPGIGRHRNPHTVSTREQPPRQARQLPPTPDLAMREPEPALAGEQQLKRAELSEEEEKRMEEMVEEVVRDLHEAKARNEQKNKRRARLARFHP